MGVTVNGFTSLHYLFLSAKSFFAKFALDQESYYAEDLNKLSTVTKQEHMKGSQIMENFK